MIHLLMLLLLSSCSMNFQNISTNGTAKDIVDDQADPDIKPNVQLPAKL